MYALEQMLLSLSFVVLAAVNPPYSADVVTVRDGKTYALKVWSDGNRRKTETVDSKGEKSGNLVDPSKKLSWMYGVGYPCIQMPANPGGAADPKEEPAGSDTIDGHPAKKFKSTQIADDGKTKKTYVEYVWRATDLQNLIIQRESLDGSFKTNLRNIKIGQPDPKVFAMPKDCRYDEMADTANNAAQPAGGFRTVRFSDASCKTMIPLPVTLSIPSDYAIRKNGHMGCFWGAEDDLNRVIAAVDRVDFESIKRGVYWCRISDSTEYDPFHKVFVSAMGPDSQWASAMAREGNARGVSVKHLSIGTLPALDVRASVEGQHVYMLYIGVADSPAILINYHPAGRGGSADETAWNHFVGSLTAESKKSD
jgi:hypothetical protein